MELVNCSERRFHLSPLESYNPIRQPCSLTSSPRALQFVFRALHAFSLEAKSCVALTQEKEDVEGSAFARGDLTAHVPRVQQREYAKSSEPVGPLPTEHRP